MVRAQAGLEILLLVALFSASTLFVVHQITVESQAVPEQNAKMSLENLAGAVERVRMQGSGASETVEIFIPDNVDASRTFVENGAINLAVNDNGGIKDIAIPVGGCISGNLPTEPGYHKIAVTGGSCTSLGSAAISISPLVLYEWVGVGEEKTVQIEFDSTTPANITFQANGEIIGLVSPDLIELETPNTFNLTISAPDGTEPGTYRGTIKASSGASNRVISVTITVYQTHVGLNTFLDAERTILSNSFNTNEPIYFTVTLKRNELLSKANLSYSLSRGGVEVVSGTGYTDTGVFDGVVSGTDVIGNYNLSASETNSGSSAYKLLNVVMPVAWMIDFVPEFVISNKTAPAELRFRVLDQRGFPVANLPIKGKKGYRSVVPMGSANWRFKQLLDCGDTCDPKLVSCPLPPNWSQIFFDDSSWGVTSAPNQNWKYFDGSSWKNCDHGCTRLYRKEFNLGEDDLNHIKKIRVTCESDEGCTCYLNGVEVGHDPTCKTSTKPWKRTNSWEFTTTSMLVAGTNVFACHVTQDELPYHHVEYFDAKLELYWDYNDGVSVEWVKKIGPPSMHIYNKGGLNKIDLFVLNDGDYYGVVFDPQKLALEGGYGAYEIKVKATCGEIASTPIKVSNVITFNLEFPPEEGLLWRAELVNPGGANVPAGQQLDVQVAVVDQQNRRVNNHEVWMWVKDMNAGSVIKKCAPADVVGGIYQCTLSAAELTAGHTYKVRVRDKTLQSLDHFFEFTFNGV